MAEHIGRWLEVVLMAEMLVVLSLLALSFGVLLDKIRRLLTKMEKRRPQRRNSR